MRVWRIWSLPAAMAAALVVTIWDATPADARTLCVGRDSVLLRSGPSWRDNPVGSLPARACGIQLVGQCMSGWCHVALGDRKGWVDARQVIVQDGNAAPRPPKRADPPSSPSRQAAPAPQRPAPPPATGATGERDGHCVMGVRQGDTLRIRTGPGVEHREVGGIPPDACGVAVGSPCRGSWCPVAYRGIRGWSNASYLRPPWMQ